MPSGLGVYGIVFNGKHEWPICKYIENGKSSNDRPLSIRNIRNHHAYTLMEWGHEPCIALHAYEHFVICVCLCCAVLCMFWHGNVLRMHSQSNWSNSRSDSMTSGKAKKIKTIQCGKGKWDLFYIRVYMLIIFMYMHDVVEEENNIFFFMKKSHFFSCRPAFLCCILFFFLFFILPTNQKTRSRIWIERKKKYQQLSSIKNGHI